MRTCSVVLLGVLAMVWLAPAQAEESGLYVGFETRSQRAEASVEKASRVSAMVPQVMNVTDPEIRNSINAIRVGYIQEIGSDLFFDGSVALGSVNGSSVLKIVDPTSPGDEDIEVFGAHDGSFYLDIAAGVRGIAGGLSYTGGIRLEFPGDIDEDQDKSALGVRETLFVDQFCFAIEGTIGATVDDMRYFVGAGLHFYSAELELTWRNNIADPFDDDIVDIEYEYDNPFVVFIGIETRTERVNAFARIALIGEKFLSGYAGAAVKF